MRERRVVRRDRDGRRAAPRLDGPAIVPPTSQNQIAIEADLRRLVERGLDLPDAELAHLCERGVRNHDPCISCAAHFLRLDIERG